MKDFAALFAALDGTTATGAKVAALADWFGTAAPEDRLWTLAIFTGRRPRRTVTSTELRQWGAAAAGMPDWLFEDAYAVAGDLAETLALLLPPPGAPVDRPLAGWIARLRALQGAAPEDRRAAILADWDALPADERFLYNKLLTGGWRIGVARGLIVRALARATGQPEAD